MDFNAYYDQIDIIKGIAIICVLILHILPSVWSNAPVVTLTISQCVPIFFFIMGLNGAMSFKRKNLLNLDELYSLTYFKKKFLRLLPSFFLIYLLAVLLCVLTNTNIQFDYMYLLAMMPHGDNWFLPGNYFITITFQFVLFFPLIYYFYEKYGKNNALIWGFLINLLFEIFASFTSLYQLYPYLYSANILRYLFIIILGTWIVDVFDINDLKSLFSNNIFKIGLIMSFIYVLIVILNIQLPYIVPIWTTSKLFIFFYTTLICALGFKYLPTYSESEFSIQKTLGYFGKASYHIFLIQMVLFGVYHAMNLPIKQELYFIVLFIILILILGSILFEAEKKLFSYLGG